MLAGGCTAVAPERDRVVTFSREHPGSFIEMHKSASPAIVQGAKCFELDAEDADARVSVHMILSELFSERLPILPPCHRGDDLQIKIYYRAGYGVNVHGVERSNRQRTGYAFFTVYSADGEDLGSGEWGYWRGGTPEIMAQQFVFDFTDLLVRGLQKPAI
jgi:hypothetical protein